VAAPAAPAASSDISSVSSGGAGSGVSGWTGNRSDIADQLLFMFSPAVHLPDHSSGSHTQQQQKEEQQQQKEKEQKEKEGGTAAGGGGGGSEQASPEMPLARMLAGAGVPSALRAHESLEHLDAEIVIELFTENQSITVFIEEMSKFEVPRIISSKLFMHLKSIVRGL